MVTKENLLDGPIPGENYTSDTRNYPWHRPPDITDLNEAVEWSIEKLTDERGSMGLLTLIQSGMTIAQAADIFVTSGIGKGKWTPDYAILLAGPVARIIEMMAKGYDIKYTMGTEQAPPVTFEYLQAVNKSGQIDEGKAGQVANDMADALNAGEEVDPVEPGMGQSMKPSGFMAMAEPQMNEEI